LLLFFFFRVATLGDSAAMLGRANGPTKEEPNSIMVSNAQTPGRPDEVKRIEAANGWVEEGRVMNVSRLHGKRGGCYFRYFLSSSFLLLFLTIHCIFFSSRYGFTGSIY
jgi:hypothetical protein